MENIKYYRLDMLIDIKKGTQIQQNSNNDNEEYEEVRIMNCLNIRYFINLNTNSLGCKPQKIIIKNKDNYIKKGDIVLPVFPKKDKLEVMYINKLPNNKAIYNEDVLRLRLKEYDENMAKYIYAILNSDYIKKEILKMSANKKDAQTRITKKGLSALYIPIPDLESREEITNEYFKIEQAKKDYNIKINKLYIKGVSNGNYK